MTLDQKTINLVRALFGTIRNAYVCLGLEGSMSYNTAYRAFNGVTVRDDHVDTITQAWARWSEKFLRSAPTAATTFTLSARKR